MKRNLQVLTVPVAIAASLLVGCSTEPITSRTDPNRPSNVQVAEGYDTFGRKWGYDTSPPVIQRAGAILLNFTGTITDIDYANRELTLRDQQGQLETFVVDKEVLRLNEAKVGDKVSVDYYLGYNGVVRKPTAEEERNPLVVLEAPGRAGRDAPPSAYDVRQVRAVVTIEKLDRPNQTVTVKGPRGKYFVVRAANPSQFERVHIGDTVVMTFTEATAISLKPAAIETAR